MEKHSVAVARNAMATRFEVVLHGANPASLRAAAEEALDEVERLEADLSLYRPTSPITHINARADKEAVRVPPHVFRLLQKAQQLSRETHGAFDITVGPLMRCWGFVNNTGHLPSPEQIAEARAKVGMQWVELNEADSTVRFARERMMLDLGSIGKGYALDKAVEVLREGGVTTGLIHGGTSSVCAIGKPFDADNWKVAIGQPDADPNGKPIAVVRLCDESLSVSGTSGKAFTVGGVTYGHVIDPRSGQPIQGALLSACILPSATEADAFTTALLALCEGGPDWLAAARRGSKSLVALRDGKIHSSGIALIKA